MNTLKIKIPQIDGCGIELDTAADILKRGGTVGIPTETVYGLAANAYDTEAVGKIFIAKGRPQDNPLIVHIADMDMLSDLVTEVPESAKKLAAAFWPGPLTMVLGRSDKIPAAVSAGMDTVAVRMPSNAVARELIRRSGCPLAAPSANLSGSPSPTTAQHVIKDLDGRIDAVVVSGDCEVGVESTVILLAKGNKRLLRPGGITPEQLRGIIGDIEIDESVLTPVVHERVSSPGMKYKHYSPKTKVILVEGSDADFAEFIAEHSSENIAAICFDEDAAKLSVPYITYGGENDAKAQAHELFDALRRADDMHADVIYTHSPGHDGVALAVYNRLLRAAAFEVIKL